MVLDQSFSGFSSSFEDMKFMVNLSKVLKRKRRSLSRSMQSIKLMEICFFNFLIYLKYNPNRP